ncbi:hypothetical protein BDW75DRAFT_233225 [Aspergillus navahoensis]
MANSCGALYLIKTDNSCYDIAASTTATATTTTTSGEVSTPTPTQAGMDGCSDIAANNGIVLDELYLWNPVLNGDCSGLWPDYYICVGVGSATTTSTATTTTAPGAVATPTPIQSGMVSGCKSFYYIQSGDSCYDITAENGIALNTLYVWNPALNGDCSGLWPDYYLCVWM